MSRWVAIVGSRNTPEPILELMIRLGRTYTDMGIGDSSGDAFDSDRAGWYGAKQSKEFDITGCRIFLNKGFRNGQSISNFPGFIDTRYNCPKKDMAEAMALKARGTFAGLNAWGIELHTRNVYQIFGLNLDEPVEACIFYAEPKRNDTVSGGTNTAYQLAKEGKIPVIKNLYLEEDREWAKQFLAENERDYPYVEINWYEIHKPDDPRLQDFEE
ncbi:hypothetical protein PHABIO_320 [Pseudomonas phage Phabio]|uniref:Uncharacterized protein n=1 Tax=Pseudomonas phage Phabio TaxID=2006668 RepID=A0A1Y0STX1_9CAUD|nr:DprA-like DNA recombination-mediator protein [Pseudomonas phage Phabio]ARV76951.1 hypothetical protein PHABIO_320 [Pseudomonas phage Phabio]